MTSTRSTRFFATWHGGGCGTGASSSQAQVECSQQEVEDPERSLPMRGLWVRETGFDELEGPGERTAQATGYPRQAGLRLLGDRDVQRGPGRDRRQDGGQLDLL